METLPQKTEPLICETHALKPLQFICLDPHCSKSSNACILCVKKDHIKCKDEYLILSNEIDERVSIERPQAMNKELREKLIETIDIKFFELNMMLQNKKQALIQSLKVDGNSTSTISPKVLECMRRTFKIDYDAAKDKIVMNPKLDHSDDRIIDSIELFDKTLNTKLTAFVQGLDILNFNLNSRFNRDDWNKHKNISIQSEIGRLILAREKEDITFNYFCAIYKQPLDQPVKIKMTVLSIYESDRFLDFGIVPESKLKNIETNSMINSFGSAGISYCGYSHTGGLTGKSLASGSSDTKGFKPDEICIMDYRPGDSLRFYNHEDTLDMKVSMANKPEPYFLFLVFYHPQASCALEYIS